MSYDSDITMNNIYRSHRTTERNLSTKVRYNRLFNNQTESVIASHFMIPSRIRALYTPVVLVTRAGDWLCDL